MNEKYFYTDIRQSDQWFDFWESMGWKRKKFSTDLSARILKSSFGTHIIIEQPKEINDEMLREIDKFAKENNAFYLQIKPGITQICDSLEKDKYSYVKCPVGVTKTGIIDLRASLDVIHKNLSYRVRHLIKTSQSMTNVNITSEYSDGDVDEFYNIYRENGLLKRFFIYPRNYFHSFMKSFKNKCFLYIAKDKNNEYLGGCVFATKGKTAWYIYAAMNDKGRDLALGYAMIWEGIVFLKNKGFEFLDLEGLCDERYPKTYKSHQGYSSFKEHFRPDIVYFPKIRIKYFNKLYEIMSLV